MATESCAQPTPEEHAKRIAEFVKGMQARGSVFLEFGRLGGFPDIGSYEDYLIEAIACTRELTEYARMAGLSATWEAQDGTQASGRILGWYFNYDLAEDFYVGIATRERPSSAEPDKIEFSKLRSIGGVSLASLAD